MIFYLLIVVCFLVGYRKNVKKLLAQLIQNFFVYVQKNKDSINHRIDQVKSFLGILEDDSPKADLHGNTIIIHFSLSGKGYVLCLPYNRRLGRSGKKVIGIKEGKELDLKHHPGLELYISPFDLGYDTVKICDVEEERTFQQGDTIEI